jgi:hypothetical protein
MAVGQKVGAAKAPAAGAGGPKNVSVMRPDQFQGGGLPDDFDGTISEVRFVPWNYPTENKPEGTIDHHILAARVTIEREDEGAPVVQHYSAGELEHFAPSMDGESPVDLEGDDIAQMEGVYAYKVGKKEALASSSNWSHFLTALYEAGMPYEDMSPDVRFLEGLQAHFNRVPQRKRSGMGSDQGGGDGKRIKEILVITEIKGRADAKAAGATKKAATATAKASPLSARATAKTQAAPAVAEEANGEGDLSARLAEAIVNATREAGGTLAKSKLAQVAIKNFKGAEKTEALALATNAEFLEGLAESNAYWDADEGTLTLSE